MKVPFRQVDVFTTVPFRGNPVAVVFEGDSLSTEQMQVIAGWTNLSETTFVCAPAAESADYRLRIFTPKGELPFAGHPTIGSAWALLEQGQLPRTPGRLVQECGKGLIALRIDEPSLPSDERRLYLALPEPRFIETDEHEISRAARALGIPADSIASRAIVDIGAVWLTLGLPSAQAVLDLEPDMRMLAGLGPRFTGVTVFGLHQTGARAAIEVRSFAPVEGVPEDPVCGSGNGGVAALIQRDGLLRETAYIASQGTRLGRRGEVHVEFAGDGTIWLGGSAITCIEGSMHIQDSPDRPL